MSRRVLASVGIAGEATNPNTAAIEAALAGVARNTRRKC